MSLHVACIQLNAMLDEQANIAAMDTHIRAAAALGASFILTPECSNIMGADFISMKQCAQSQEDSLALQALQQLAAELKIWLCIGSLIIKGPNGRLYNRSYMLNPSGQIIAHYDKLHLFDATLSTGLRYSESSIYDAGNQAVIVQTDWGKVGLSICYDVRFPHLYRAMTQQGASFFTVPAAFTRETGQLHWHVLLRARAIENGAFVFAANQCGTHQNGRETYGHSMIIAPSGAILAEAGEEEGFIHALIDPHAVDTMRTNIPSMQQQRDIPITLM